jgi:hypothetical protein
MSVQNVTVLIKAQKAQKEKKKKGPKKGPIFKKRLAGSYLFH